MREGVVGLAELVGTVSKQAREGEAAEAGVGPVSAELRFVFHLELLDVSGAVHIAKLLGNCSLSFLLAQILALVVILVLGLLLGSGLVNKSRGVVVETALQLLNCLVGLLGRLGRRGVFGINLIERLRNFRLNWRRDLSLGRKGRSSHFLDSVILFVEVAHD